MNCISETDRRVLDELVGRALLYEDVRENLLKQERRSYVLAHLPLSLGAVDRVMALSDMPEIEELAAEIYKTVFLP